MISGVIIPAGSRYFTGQYLKTVRSKNMNKKKFELLTNAVYITPDEVHDSYVNIDEDMMIDIQHYNALIQKAKK